MKYLSPIPPNTEVGYYQLGAKMLGLGTTEQGLEVAGVLNAKREDGRPLYRDVTVQLARRSAKTTTIQCELLGRCASIPGTKVIQTAQDGTRASEVFTQMLDELDSADPADDPKARQWTAFRSTGREYLKFKNGSIWRVVAPKPGSFRSKAADVVWFDESGELDPEESERIEAGALPVMDTRPNGQVIRSGTPGEIRAGTFWTALETARREPDRFGIVDYCATDEEVAGMDPDEFPAELVQRIHPGVISGLTTLEVIEERWARMDLPKFLREYLCVWPPDTGATALDLAVLEELTTDPVAVPPQAWALGYDVAIGGGSASSASAWYAGGELHVQVMDHRLGSGWLVEDLGRALHKHPRLTISYDSIGGNISIAQDLGRMPRVPKTALRPLALKDVAAATSTLVRHIDERTLVVHRSKSLTAAAESASWRDSGGSRLFGRIHGRDISALLAAVAAIGGLQRLPQRAPMSLPTPA